MLTPGGQVDLSPEAQVQRQLASTISLVKDTIKARQGVEASEDQLGQLHQVLGLAWGQACASMLPQVPGDSDDMDTEDVADEQRASKAAKKGGDGAQGELSAREAARLRGDEIEGEDADDDLKAGGAMAAAWTQVGSDKAREDFEKLCRQFQCGDDEELAARVQQKQRLKTQGVAKARAKAKAANPATGSATGLPAPATPRATAWDAKAGSERHTGLSNEQEMFFPPLQAKAASRSAPGTPAQASGTGSFTARPLDVGASSTEAPTGNAPPAQGTVSPTELPSAVAPTTGAPPVPPAEGQENGRGDGTAA